VLDVGAASGDMGACLRREFPLCSVVSLDRKPLHMRRASPPRIAADAFRLPFPPRSFDFITSSLVLHHYREEEIVALIAGWRAAARQAVIVLDLERHPLAYHFLPLTRWLFRWTDMTVHDGCASVEAGFHADELAALAREAGARDAVVRRHMPWFRISAVIPA
jgi:ubiquinone/menaquinone biosynthesis C-methylase UbiE